MAQPNVLLARSAVGIYGLALIMASVGLARSAPGLARVASGALAAGLALQLASGMGPLVTPWTITGAYVFLGVLAGYVTVLRYDMRGVLAPLLALPVAFSLAWCFVDPAFAPFGHHLDGPWCQLHLVLLVAAYAAFSAAGSLGAMLLVRARTLKAKSTGTLATALPPLMLLDRATLEALQAGLFLLTLSVVAAVVHAISVGWASAGKLGKLGMAAAVWGTWALALYGRHRQGWTGERVGWLAVVGVFLSFAAFAAMAMLGKTT